MILLPACLVRMLMPDRAPCDLACLLFAEPQTAYYIRAACARFVRLLRDPAPSSGLPAFLFVCFPVFVHRRCSRLRDSSRDAMFVWYVSKPVYTHTACTNPTHTHTHTRTQHQANARHGKTMAGWLAGWQTMWWGAGWRCHRVFVVGGAKTVCVCVCACWLYTC